MFNHTKILSCGSYLPDKILTNDDLAKTVDTNDAWKARRAALKGSFASLRLFQQEYQEENIKIATEKLMDELFLILKYRIDHHFAGW